MRGGRCERWPLGEVAAVRGGRCAEVATVRGGRCERWRRWPLREVRMYIFVSVLVVGDNEN